MVRTAAVIVGSWRSGSCSAAAATSPSPLHRTPTERTNGKPEGREEGSGPVEPGRQAARRDWISRTRWPTAEKLRAAKPDAPRKEAGAMLESFSRRSRLGPTHSRRARNRSACPAAVWAAWGRYRRGDLAASPAAASPAHSAAGRRMPAADRRPDRRRSPRVRAGGRLCDPGTRRRSGREDEARQAGSAAELMAKRRRGCRRAGEAQAVPQDGHDGANAETLRHLPRERVPLAARRGALHLLRGRQHRVVLPTSAACSTRARCPPRTRSSSPSSSTTSPTSTRRPRATTRSRSTSRWARARGTASTTSSASACRPTRSPPTRCRRATSCSSSTPPARCRSPNRLPLVKQSLNLLVDKLAEKDRVSIVTYAGDSRVALGPDQGDREGDDQGRRSPSLSASGGTNGEGGIKNAYDLARETFIDGGVNRVILCTDGDFNVGVTEPGRTGPA